MLIVCTNDQTIRAEAQDPGSGANLWGGATLITANLDQAGATTELQYYMEQLGADEPLCLSAHGNDTEIGDENPQGWTWTTSDIAGLLKVAVPAGYSGDILIHACANTVANFSAGLAVELERIAGLCGVWIYGYNVAVPTTARYPDPAKLRKQVDLQSAKVTC